MGIKLLELTRQGRRINFNDLEAQLHIRGKSTALRTTQDDLYKAVDVLKDMLERLDKRLAESEYVAGNSYTVADISIYPDVHLHGVKDIGLSGYPDLKRWHDAIEARPAVKKAWTPFT